MRDPVNGTAADEVMNWSEMITQSLTGRIRSMHRSFGEGTFAEVVRLEEQSAQAFDQLIFLRL